MLCKLRDWGINPLLKGWQRQYISETGVCHAWALPLCSLQTRWSRRCWFLSGERCGLILLMRTSFWKKHKRKAACQYIQLLNRSGSRLFNDWSEITAMDVNAWIQLSLMGDGGEICNTSSDFLVNYIHICWKQMSFYVSEVSLPHLSWRHASVFPKTKTKRG